MAATATRNAAPQAARSVQWRQHARTTYTYSRAATRHATTHLGDQLIPYAATGALLAAAAAAQAAKHLTGNDAQIMLGTAATAFVVAVVAATRIRRRVADRKLRQRALLFAAVAAGWLTYVTATGLNLTASVILGGLSAALNAYWWRVHRIPNTAAVAAPAPVDAPVGDVYAQRWRTSVGADGREAPGTRLIDPDPIDSGTRYTLKLVAGKQTYSTIMGLHENIVGALELLPDQDVIIERHPTLPANYLRATVVTKSPIATSVEWPGPSAFNPDTGRAALGPHSDGDGVADWRVYTENSLWGGFIAGDPGSGKSRLFESLSLSIGASDTHPTVIWFADGDEGASSPMLAEHADHVALDAELEQARAMFAGALLIMRLRRAENVAYKLSGFTPTPERPGLLIFVDECHVLFAQPDLRLMASEITRRGRKVGVNIVAASQVATLDAFGGAGKDGADALRLSLRAGNAVCLKSSTANTKEVFGVQFNPAKFPDLPGYGYRVNGKGDTARTAPFRGYYVDDKALASWPKRITWRSLSEGEGNAYGPEYARRKEIAEETQAEVLAWIEAVKSGRAGVRAAGKPAASGGDGASADPLVVFNWPTWQTPEVRTSGPALEDRHRKVLAAMQSGAHRPKEIVSATGYSAAWVHQVLAELGEFGLVRSRSYGRYELVVAA